MVNRRLGEIFDVPKVKITGGIGILLIFLVVFYWEHIIGKKFFPFDSKDQLYPFAVFVSQSYRNGEIPLWNPYIYSGTPSFADPLYSTFYPGNIFLVFPSYLTQNWFDLFEIIHIAIGGIFLFFLLGNFGIGFWNSLIGSIVYMFSGPFVGRVQHVPQILSSSLIPLSLFLVHHGIKKRSYLILGMAGIVLGFTIMIGYQVAILFFIFVIIPFFIIEYVIQDKKDWRQFLRIQSWLFFVLIVAAGVSTIQVIPSLELTHLSNRPKFSLLDASNGSMNPLMFFIMLFPNLFGSLEYTLIEYVGPFDITESYIYVGVVPIFFIFVSFLNYKKLRIFHKFFLWVALLGAIYALGKFTPLFPLLYNLIPFLHLFKRPSESLFIYHLGLSISVAYGIDLISKYLDQRRLVLKFLFIFIALYFVLLNWAQLFANEFGMGDNWFFKPNLIFLGFFIALTIFVSLRDNRFITKQIIYSIVLCGIIFGDLLTTNSNRVFNSTEFEFINIDKNTIYNCDDLVTSLKEGLKEKNYRFESIRAGSISTNSSAILELPSSVGYSPLVVGRYDEFAKPIGTWKLRDFSGFIRGLDSPLYDLLGVKYIFSTVDLKEIDPAVDVQNGKYQKKPSSCFNFYENNDALPLMYMVNKVIVANTKSIQEYLIDPTFDPANFVVLEKLPEALTDYTKQGEIIVTDKLIKYTIEVKERKNNSITIQVHSEGNGILIYNDVYYPGWRVIVDGFESEVLQTNYTFKGVYVSRGEHEIQFIFTPSSFYLGLSITLITTFIVLFLSILNSKHILHKR